MNRLLARSVSFAAFAIFTACVGVGYPTATPTQQDACVPKETQTPFSMPCSSLRQIQWNAIEPNSFVLTPYLNGVFLISQIRTGDVAQADLTLTAASDPEA